MVDRELEFKIKRLKEFMQLWVKFHDMYKNALSQDTISPENETSFLETKSLIARKYQALKDHLGVTTSYEDKTFDVISQLLSLKSVAAISDLSLHKIESDWHNSYIILNKLLGELEGKQETLRKISVIGLLVRKLSSSPIFNLILAIAIIVGVYFLIIHAQKSYRAQQPEVESKIEFRGKE
jgi:hypothetical protein